MSVKSNHFKIGLFIISACILATAGVVILGAGSMFEKRLDVETYFDTSVQGLDVGSPVKYRGVKIGRVDEIKLAGMEYSRQSKLVMVRFSISCSGILVTEADNLKAELAKEVEHGLRVRITPQGVTGTAYLEVDYLQPGKNPPMDIDWTPHTLYVPSAPSVITEISQSLTSITASLKDADIPGIITRLEKTLDAAAVALESVEVKSLSEQANGLLQELRVSNRQLGSLLTGKEAHTIVADAKDVVSSAKRIVLESEEPIKNALVSLKNASIGVNRLTAKLDAATKDMPEAVSQLRVTLKRLDALLSIPQEDLESTMDNIRALSENLKDLSETSTRYPSYVLFGKPPDKKNPGDN